MRSPFSLLNLQLEHRFMTSWLGKLWDLIKSLFQGFKVYFGPEFRFYTITFFFFLALVGVLAPIFILFQIDKFGGIELVYLIGCSSAIIYGLYTILCLKGSIRDIFLQSKWKYILGIIVPIIGTIGFIFLFVFLYRFGIVAYILNAVLKFGLLGAFLSWLVIQLLTMALFLKDFNISLMDRFKNETTKNRNLILFSLLFLGTMVLYVYGMRPLMDEISVDFLKPAVLIMRILPLVMTILAGVILLIALIRRKSDLSFFSTSYILFYNAYLAYHIIYLVIYAQSEIGIFVELMTFISIALFIFTVVYALQSAAGVFKSRMKRWQPISFFLFTNSLLYVTWTVTFLNNLAGRSLTFEDVEGIFWSINHVVSYIFGILLVAVTVFIFMKRLKKKKELKIEVEPKESIPY